MTAVIRVLLVDDDENDAVFIRRRLAAAEHVKFEMQWVPSYELALDALRAPHDVSLIDGRLGSHDGLALIREAFAAGNRVPMIMLTGHGDGPAAMLALEAGASDYLTKDELTAPSLERAIRYALDRKRSDSALRASEQLYRALFESSPFPKWLCDAETLRFLTVNDAAIRHYGYSRAEFLQKTILEIRPPGDVASVEAAVRGAPREPAPRGIWKHRKKDGSVIDVDVSAHAIELQGRASWLVIAQDVTERLRLEAKLLQAQKMDAVGRLAGGVAHEFNNLLSIVLSYSELISGELPPDSRLRLDVSEIHTAAGRAAELTRQLLAVGRRQHLQPLVLDVGEVASGMSRMLRTLLGENVQLTVASEANLWSVEIDPGQFEQVIMNVALNARDAMPDGGTLTIEATNVQLDEEYSQGHPGARAGPHVLLRMSDSGVGMDRETVSHMFEPFFTTKGIGKGTGLGLSTVFGIVEQSGGSVSAESEPGGGTTVSIYLPASGAELSNRISLAAPHPTPLPGTETVLLVADEERVRVLACAILRRLGYTVLEAQSAGDALLVSEQHPSEVHLLVTDLAMPRMSGRQLAERLAPSRPGMKVLYLSGNNADEATRRDVQNRRAAFLEKPFAPGSLAAAVREALAVRSDG